MALEPTQIPLEKLKRLVFKYESSKADEKFFRQEICKYLMGTDHFEFIEVCWHMVWVRNRDGRDYKYIHFNERNQRLYLDKYFYEWCKRTLEQMKREIKLIAR